MKNMLTMTKSGLAMLEKIVRSCTPTPTNGGMPSKEYLMDLVRRGQDISFDEFRKNFPPTVCIENLYNVYDHLRAVVGRDKRESVEKEEVIRFFAGTPHIERAMTDVENEGLAEIIGQAYARRAFVSHVLLAVEITGTDGKHLSGVYRNGGVEIPMNHLVAFPEEAGVIRKGTKVLVHYASIVLADVDDGIEKRILALQAANAAFMAAADEVGKMGGIDHKKMLHFPWSEKVVSVCRI